jgi:hypothetical protein
MGLASSSMLGMALGARATKVVLTVPSDVKAIAGLVEHHRASRVMVSPWVALRLDPCTGAGTS